MVHRRLGFQICIIVFFACTSLAQTALSQTNAEESARILDKEHVRFSSNTTLDIHARVTLGPEAQNGFHQFKTTGGSYGVMYVTEDGSGFSWRSRRFSLADAKAAAKVDCEAFFQEGCTLYATLSPSTDAFGPVFIPYQNKDLWQEAVRKTRPGKFVAIAASKTGASGFSWNFPTTTQARAKALRTCEQKTRAHRVNEKIHRIVTTKREAGIYNCRLIGIFQ